MSLEFSLIIQALAEKIYDHSKEGSQDKENSEPIATASKVICSSKIYQCVWWWWCVGVLCVLFACSFVYLCAYLTQIMCKVCICLSSKLTSKLTLNVLYALLFGHLTASNFCCSCNVSSVLTFIF